MSKKQLDEENIFNELKGGSAFFPGKPATPLVDSPEKHGPTPPVVRLESPEDPKKDISQVSHEVLLQTNSQKVSGDGEKRVVKEKENTTTPRHHDTTIVPYPDAMIETIRKAVKQQGKEAATHRFTLEEKRLLRDVVYTYVAQGVRTSENEIARIAIHYLIADYHENNQMSVLARVLEKLNG
jgi:hypothetical protein